jgi:hypothetical protein
MGKETSVLAIALTLGMAASLTAADSAVIVNSGSTNTAGFRISVNPSGDAEYTVTPRRSGPKPEEPAPVHQHLSDALAKRLFSDLAAAQPFISLPQPHCAKSASFGTRLTIEFGDSETPDLSCGDGDNAKLRALIQDASEVVAIFKSK